MDKTLALWKEWIDNTSYRRLLQVWKFAPIGDERFQGETGDYYKKVMNEKRFQEMNERKNRETLSKPTKYFRF